MRLLLILTFFCIITMSKSINEFQRYFKYTRHIENKWATSIVYHYGKIQQGCYEVPSYNPQFLYEKIKDYKNDNNEKAIKEIYKHLNVDKIKIYQSWNGDFENYSSTVVAGIGLSWYFDENKQGEEIDSILLLIRKHDSSWILEKIRNIKWKPLGYWHSYVDKEVDYDLRSNNNPAFLLIIGLPKKYIENDKILYYG
jgi:hypothetical protein